MEDVHVNDIVGVQQLLSYVFSSYIVGFSPILVDSIGTQIVGLVDWCVVITILALFVIGEEDESLAMTFVLLHM